MLDVASVCSGVGGIDLAFERAGMRTVGLCEWDEKCQDVLRKHWPEVVIRGDLAEVKGNRGAADLVVGGTPCQDLSVAGRRAGLAGERSSLFFEYARVIDEIGPEWVVWENVPGALTSNRGRDMGTVLGTLADLGYGVAYRVLDAQFYGVAQRRRRVIVVGRRGDVRSAAEVLALGESVPGNPPARPTARPVLTSVASASAGDGGSDGVVIPVRATVSSLTAAQGGPDDNDAQAGHYLVTAPFATFRKSRRAQSVDDFETWTEDDFANTLNVADNTGDVRATTLIVSVPSREVASARQESGGHHGHSSPRGDGSDNLVSVHGYPSSDTARCLTTGTRYDLDTETFLYSGEPLGVRRLTPRECERLQGFPDDWTRVGASGKDLADSHRYRMMGNSVAVPVFEWLGRRIVAVASRGQAAA